MHIFDMRIPWFWKKIWHDSISGNICLIEVSNPAKFDAFIKKRTILSLNSRTITQTKRALHLTAIMARVFTTLDQNLLRIQIKRV